MARFPTTLSGLVALLAGLTGPQASVAAADTPTERIAIIGTGDLGDSMGPRLARSGYQVIYGSREPERPSHQALLDKSGPDARVVSQQEAAQGADTVILAVTWPAMETVAQELGDLAGKVLIDVSFPMRQGADGYMESMVETSSAELIQDWNPDARVVKLDAPGSFLFDRPDEFGERVTMFIAANDVEAKERVAKIVFAMGFEPLDAGPLRHAREIEASGHLYMVPLLQGRREGWEFSIQRSTYWPCFWDISESFAPVADADRLAEFPESPRELKPCDAFANDR